MRLERLVAQRMGTTRREARRCIRRGRVEVDGCVERDPTRSVGEGVALWVDGAPAGPPPRLVAYHKPVGVLSTVGDPHGRTSLADTAAAWLERGLHPVGRLDADSEGLLLFSSDGSLTQRLLHPKHGVAKCYDAWVDGMPSDALGEQLASGVATAAGTFTAELKRVEGDKITLVVREGKHRMVRRMLANVGLPVVRLVRRAMGPYELGDLAPGAFRIDEAGESS